MSDRPSIPPRAVGPRTRRPALAAPSVTALDVVGIGHVVLGAQGLGAALFGLVMQVDQAGLAALLVFGLLAAVGAGTALAGLWLKDGRRRGALLAGILDVGRLVLLLLAWPRASAVDLLLTATLLGGVVWVLPTLSRDGDGRAARPPRR